MASLFTRLYHRIWPRKIRVGDTPFLTADAILFLERYLSEHPSAAIFETGGGGSTVWFALRAKTVTTFEHNPRWARAIRKKLRGSTNVDLRLYELPYTSQIGNLPDDHFDLVLIDGRDRVESVKQAARLVRLGGFLAVDDTERIGTAQQPGRYFGIDTPLSGWPRRDFSTPTGRTTTIWRRPGA
jgi:predicted O-methyltransferase YrrM